jgi:predicted nucleic acid-binding protein
VIYLDTSALAKLLVRGPESAALQAWLAPRTTEIWTTSAVGRVELLRLAARHDVVASAVALADGLDLVPLTDQVASMAALVAPESLRTLDAIHLASALSVQDELADFCCYDARLSSAAAAVGLAVHPPVR